ncbi:hypothetical protein H4219_000766 [Mycoemilia scoparia]|uniref:SCP domain-containing protein n=1 Tax=Mycoemilia scoparia TaxID=417184 RepID=A0A9W8DW61_9FUNG|nr:hypothetical protein H4219_000766 [Mycoemilia scoparia]
MKLTTSLTIFGAVSAASLVAQAGISTQTCCYTNIQRRKHGFPDMAWNNELAQLALEHSEEQAQRKVDLTHDGFSPQTKDLQTRMERLPWDFLTAFENLTRGIPKARDVVEAWINHPGHRENILNHNATVCGAGISTTGDYFTADYASPRDPAQNKKFSTLDCSDPENPVIIPPGASAPSKPSPEANSSAAPTAETSATTPAEKPSAGSGAPSQPSPPAGPAPQKPVAQQPGTPRNAPQPPAPQTPVSQPPPLGAAAPGKPKKCKKVAKRCPKKKRSTFQ